MDPRAHMLSSIVPEKRKSLTAAKIQTPDHSAHKKSLRWLCYLGYTLSTHNISHTLQWPDHITLVTDGWTCQVHIKCKPYIWTYYNKYCHETFMRKLKMHKSVQIKITHSLIRQCLMVCKLVLVLCLANVCKKIYQFPAKNYWKFYQVIHSSLPLS